MVPIVAKSRRTRQQKIIAQLKRQLMAQKPASLEKLIRQPVVEIPRPSVQVLATSQNYSFVVSDLRKTAIVTTLILIGQILTFLFLTGRR